MFGYIKRNQNDLEIDSFKGHFSDNNINVYFDGLSYIDGTSACFLEGQIFKSYDESYPLLKGEAQCEMALSMFKKYGVEFIKKIDGHHRIIIVHDSKVYLISE
jgi:hypothetical protein